MTPDNDKNPKAVSLRDIVKLIPKDKRAGAIGVIVASAALAILDFVGIAVLVPVLLLVLSQEAVMENTATQWLYDTLGFTSFNGFVIAVCVAVMLIIIVKSVLMLAVGNRITKYLLSLYRRYSTRMFDIYLSKGLLFIRNNNTSQLINNVNGVCLRFTDGVLGQVFSILTEIILLVLVGVALMIYDPRLVLLALAIFIPLTLLYALFFRRRMNENGRTENRLFVEQNKTLYETLRGYADIEINNAGGYVSHRFRNGLKTLTDCRRKASLVRSATGRLAEFSLILGVVIMIVAGLAGGEPMSSLKITLGVFAVAAYKIVPSVSKITSGWVEYKRNSFAAEKLSETFDSAPALTHLDRDEDKLPFTREITFDNVSFRYEDGGKDILDRFSLAIRKGEKIGIRGYSGAGKSTMLNLLCGFFTPSSGNIDIDGVQLTEDNRRRWQNNIALVSQDVFIPDVTIAENIAFGIARADIDLKRLERSIAAASLGELVASLPQGADTVTGEAGCRLSGGQRQRIGIARALYKDASVLLLDEATSSLDSKTESEIMDAVQHLSKSHDDLTILIISHRDNTLSFCDRIVEI